MTFGTDIHAEGPAFFSWLPKLFGKKVVVTVHGIDWQREKWKSGFGSKFIRQGEKNAVKYADEIIVLSKGVETLSDVCIKAPQTETYMIQELHLPIYHCLCLMLEDRFF